MVGAQHPPLSVLFTLDYEVFGDGSGDPLREQVIPTRYLMDILELYDARLTLFFEYGQYLAYQKFGLSDPWYLRRNEAITAQLRDAVSRGHDVQLHLHPTWRNAQLISGEIRLDTTSFDVSELPPTELTDLLSDGKRFLEGLLRAVDDDYRCVAFRAGAWSASRQAPYLAALAASGFLCDSSVVPGARYASSYGRFDYTQAPTELGWWRVSDRLDCPDPDGAIVELPIYARIERFAFLRYVNGQYRRMSRLVKEFYPHKLTDRGLGFWGRLEKILARSYVMADFNALDAESLASLVRLATTDRREPWSPLVFIGHSKSCYHLDELHRFFRSAIGKGCDFPTLSQTLGRLR